MMVIRFFKIIVCFTAALCTLKGNAQHRLLELGSTKIEGSKIDSLVLNAVVQALGTNARGSIRGDFSFPINEGRCLRVIDLKITSLHSAKYSGLVWLDSIQFEIQDGFVFRGITLRHPTDTVIINLYSKDTLLVDSLLWGFIKDPESEDHFWRNEPYNRISRGNGRLVDYILSSVESEPSILRFKNFLFGMEIKDYEIMVLNKDLQKAGIRISENASRVLIHKIPEKRTHVRYDIPGCCCRSYLFDENDRLYEVYLTNQGRPERLIKLRYKRSIKGLSIEKIVKHFPP